MDKFKKRFILLIILDIFFGVLALINMILLLPHIDWYQRLVNADTIGFFGFIISISPIVLSTLMFLYIIVKVGIAACTYEDAPSLIKQYKKAAAVGFDVSPITYSDFLGRLESTDYCKSEIMTQYDVYERKIDRRLKKDIISYVLVACGECDGIYKAVCDYCKSDAAKKNSAKYRLCFDIVYFGEYQKSYIAKRTTEFADEKCIINSIVYDSARQKVYAFNPEMLYSIAFRRMTASVLSLFE